MSHNVSSPERDPFTVILPNYKTGIPPPAWYNKPVQPASDNEVIGRPRNAFIIFLAHEHAERRARNAPKRVARELSKEIAIKWGKLSTDQKQPYEAAAAWEEVLHQLRWPEYKFAPGSKGNSKGRKAKVKAEPAEDQEIVEGHAERQVEEAEMLSEKAQMQVRKALAAVDKAQRRLENARRLADEARQRRRSGPAAMRRGIREPAPMSRQQRASSGRPQSRSSRWADKSSRKEDGHRVESAPSGNNMGQAFSYPSPLIGKDADSFGYLQGSGSYFQPEEEQRTPAGRTMVQKLDPAVLSPCSSPKYGHSQRKGLGNDLAPNFPELFLPFQQQACDLGSSSGSNFDYPTAKAQNLQSNGITGQDCVDPALLFMHPSHNYGCFQSAIA